MLHIFNARGFSNQNIYYFKSQMRNVTSNVAILTRLFDGTLKAVAFEWFKKLEPRFIQSWNDMGKLFLM